jgi:hypothetical protein
MQPILVTGAGGFVGRHLVATLAPIHGQSVVAPISTCWTMRQSATPSATSGPQPACTSLRSPPSRTRGRTPIWRGT